MNSARTRVLYVTDLAYQARGRRYCDEDIYLTAQLRARFDLALCHPVDAAALMDGFDVVVVRNSGPVVGYERAYAAFRDRARSSGAKVFNELTGRADQVGKQYLLDLFDLGYPVIPTVDRAADLGRLPLADEYVAKPKLGADSLGMRIVPRAEADTIAWRDQLVQPRIDFEYEVSFVFVDHEFCYAVHAPDPARRWELVPYRAGHDDLAFARRFIEWNGIEHGIQRVDACRTAGGDLLLVELEDLNPYLSLDRIDPAVRDSFVERMADSIHRLAAQDSAAHRGPSFGNGS